MSASTVSIQEKELTIVQENGKHSQGSRNTILRWPRITPIVHSLLAIVLLTIISCTIASPAIASNHEFVEIVNEGTLTSVSDDQVYSSPEDSLAELLKKPARLASVLPLVLGVKIFWQNRRRNSITMNISLIVFPTAAIIALMWQLPWLFGMVKLFFWLIELLVRLIVFILQFAIDIV